MEACLQLVHNLEIPGVGKGVSTRMLQLLADCEVRRIVLPVGFLRRTLWFSYVPTQLFCCGEGFLCLIAAVLSNLLARLLWWTKSCWQSKLSFSA